jgi:O-acetyl-ADP-ribose deacetylase (regulator of RNase III)
MHVVLCDIDDDVVRAWRQFCADIDGVSIQHGSILDVRCDAVVSPANSFGFMDGGVDAAYRTYFGPHVQQQVQQRIRERYAGELLVGLADIVDTGHPGIRFLVVAPTMRVPMVLRDSVNAYLAMRAVLLLVLNGRFLGGAHDGDTIAKHVQTIAVPGLGTGIGRIGPHVCAHQMRAAIEDVMLKSYKFPESWAEASERHQELYTSHIRRLQQD